MGVRGLTTLVERHSKKLLENIHLHDTKLIIDGFGLLWYLLGHASGVDPLSHGGEYEHLRAKIHFFLGNLLSCGCTPYVVFDGSFDLDDKKFDTMLTRFTDKIKLAKMVLQGQKALLMPPMSLHVMKQVMTEMGVQFAVGRFEADKEIAMLANKWLCPVLGKDSDFYIMDIIGGYIPLTSLHWKTVQKDKGVQRSLKCQVYLVSSFCETYQMEKEMLPLFATLAGNDYIKEAKLNTFLESQVYGKYEGHDTRRRTQLEHLLSWVSEQKSSTEALREVLKHIGDDSLKESLSASMDMYRVEDGTSSLQYYFEKKTPPPDFHSKSPLCSIVGAPIWVVEAHQAGSFSNLLINILSKRYCFTGVQVENPKLPSAWLPCQFLFSVICRIVLAEKLKEEKSKGTGNCLVFIRNGDGYQRFKVSPLLTLSGYGQLPTLSTIPSLTETDKQKILLTSLAPSLTSSTDLVTFPAEFRLVLLATVHWIESEHTRINESHIGALLLGWVYHFSQRKLKKLRGNAGKRATEPTHVSDHVVKKQLQLEATAMEATMGHHLGRLRTKKPDPFISHAFAQWQVCLLSAVVLNELLQCPLPNVPDMSVVFNGLTMHSLYGSLRDASGRETLQQKVATRFLRGAPSACRLFTLMLDFTMKTARWGTPAVATTGRKTSTADQSTTRPKTAKGPKRKGKPKPRTRFDPEATFDSDSDSGTEWRGSNKFAVLR